MLDIPAIEYFRGKNTWCGSHNNKRCRIAPAEKLTVTIWPEPFEYAKTDESLRMVTEFDYTIEGLDKVREHLKINMF